MVAWTLLNSPFHHNNRYKGWKRIVADKVFHHLSVKLNVRQLQWLSGTTLDVYRVFLKKQKLPVLVDDVGGGARLLWIGERQFEKVLLYIHGASASFSLMRF